MHLCGRSCRITGRIFMDNKKASIFTKGIFTLSLDTELGWGMIDKLLAF